LSHCKITRPSLTAEIDDFRNKICQEATLSALISRLLVAAQ
jgi:hypothetical protein